MRTDRPLQTIVGMGFLVLGFALYGFHLWQHRTTPACAFDVDTKVAGGVGALGLLLCPFDFGNVRAAAGVATKRVSGMFRTPNGTDGPPSGGSST